MVDDGISSVEDEIAYFEALKDLEDGKMVTLDEIMKKRDLDVQGNCRSKSRKISTERRSKDIH